MKAKVGGRFTWQHVRAKHVHGGVFLDLQKNRRLSFTWESGEAAAPPSEVAIEAQPAPYGTLVSVHHTGLLGLSRGQLSSQQMFWMRLLERLRCYFYFKGKIRAAE
ncbi:MAG: SRPBCC domain-containing protein [Acidobacteria bacterium]|nr:SRPBCC domain-containing protein [Acidobacteriota bacterium]